MTEDAPREEKSRAQIKRELGALKELGIELAALSPEQLRSIPLSEKTRAAVLQAHGMARNALPRHFRYLAALMADEDAAAVGAALAAARQPQAEAIAQLHEAERWRGRLLPADASQLAAFGKRYPGCDPKELAELVRSAKRERELDQPPKGARQLFRFIKKMVAARG